MILINEKDLLGVFHKIEALCSDSVPNKIKISTVGRPVEYQDALMLFIWIYKKFFGIRRDTELFSRGYSRLQELFNWFDLFLKEHYQIINEISYVAPKVGINQSMEIYKKL